MQSVFNCTTWAFSQAASLCRAATTGVQTPLKTTAAAVAAVGNWLANPITTTLATLTLVASARTNDTTLKRIALATTLLSVSAIFAKSLLEKKIEPREVSSEISVSNTQDQQTQTDPLPPGAAEYEFGLRHLEGRDVPQAPLKAYELFEISAQHGYAPAQYELGRFHHNDWRVPNFHAYQHRDLDKGAQLFAQAAAQGYAPAQHELGLCYLRGEGVQQDMRKSYHLVTQAANQNYANAQYLLGYWHIHDRGPTPAPKDLQLARHWSEKAAAQGHTGAMEVIRVFFDANEFLLNLSE